MVTAAYASGLDNDFVGDDLEWVRFALDVRDDPSRIFSLFSGFVTPAMNATVGLNAAAAGTEAWIYNLTGLLFHVLNVVLLKRLIAIATHSSAISWWTALWWGVHYRHDEAVFWLGGRPHVLVITGVLSALLFQHRWMRTGNRAFLGFCLLAGEFAILSKESGVMVAPLAALWIMLFERREVHRMEGRWRWSAAAGLALAAAVHAGILWGVRTEHQFYYRLDLSFLGRLAETHLAAAGIAAPDPSPAWLLIPVVATWAALFLKGGSTVRFGLMVMLLGTLPTALIEFQPPRYRYFPLAGAAFVLAGLAAALMPRLRQGLRPIAAAAPALLCAWLAIGVLNDEAFLDEAGRIHRSLRDAFCDSARQRDPAEPLVVIWDPAFRGVEALKDAATRERWIDIRNYPPIYVRVNGLEGMAEAETLLALCEDGAAGPRVGRLLGAGALDRIQGGEFDLMLYADGRFRRGGETEKQEALQTIAATFATGRSLPDRRLARWAVLVER